MTARYPSTRVTESRDVFARVGRWLGDESGDRTRPIILAVVVTLATIGLVLVASASSVESVANGLNPYDLPLKQGMWTVAACSSCSAWHASGPGISGNSPGPCWWPPLWPSAWCSLPWA